ncbi:MAG: hypothetical protein RIB84_15230 [Sneathiellaceae bacterium]
MRPPIGHATDRRTALAGGAALLTGALALGDAAAAATTAPATESRAVPVSDYAIFTEFSPETKPMVPGWNRRVFTDTDVRKGDAIQCDFATGAIALAPGLYHITGMSIAPYFSVDDPPEMTTIRAPASAGYSRLRSFDPDFVLAPGLRGIENDDPSIICVGSSTTANLTPSLVEAYFEPQKTAQIILEYQSGSKPDGIYLRVHSENSRWHAMARICIRRI